MNYPAQAAKYQLQLLAISTPKRIMMGEKSIINTPLCLRPPETDFDGHSRIHLPAGRLGVKTTAELGVLNPKRIINPATGGIYFFIILFANRANL